MISVDIPCDLSDEDETGFVWAFVDEAADPLLITPGAIVVAGDAGRQPARPPSQNAFHFISRNGKTVK